MEKNLTLTDAEKALAVARTCFDVTVTSGQTVSFCPLVVWEQFSEYLRGIGWCLKECLLSGKVARDTLECHEGLLFEVSPLPVWKQHPHVGKVYVINDKKVVLTTWYTIQ